jgi:hypothetical protein
MSDTATADAGPLAMAEDAETLDYLLPHIYPHRVSLKLSDMHNLEKFCTAADKFGFVRAEEKLAEHILDLSALPAVIVRLIDAQASATVFGYADTVLRLGVLLDNDDLVLATAPHYEVSVMLAASTIDKLGTVMQSRAGRALVYHAISKGQRLTGHLGLATYRSLMRRTKGLAPDGLQFGGEICTQQAHRRTVSATWLEAVSASLHT